MSEIYAINRLDALRRLRAEGYAVVDKTRVGDERARADRLEDWLGRALDLANEGGFDSGLIVGMDPSALFWLIAEGESLDWKSA